MPSIRNTRPGVSGGRRFPIRHWRCERLGVVLVARDRDDGAGNLHPGARAEDRGDRAGRRLGQVTDADDHRVVLVGEVVERRDRVADVGVVVRVLAGDVVADRVDHEHRAAAEVDDRLVDRSRSRGELHPAGLRDQQLRGVAACGDDPRLQIDRRRILGGDPDDAAVRAVVAAGARAAISASRVPLPWPLRPARDGTPTLGRAACP